jgi:hypothetical protein
MLETDRLLAVHNLFFSGHSVADFFLLHSLGKPAGFAKT